MVGRSCKFLVAGSVLAFLAVSAAHAQAPAAGSAPAGGNTAPTGAAPRTVAVALGKAERKPMPVRFDTIGSVQAVATVTLRSRVESQITEVAFRDGAVVKKGDVMLRLDARGIEAQVKQAEANLARSQAQLEQAQRDVKRYEQLILNDAGSRLNLDNARTQAATLNAQIKADEASLENLRVTLTHYTILAPITGRAGVAGLKEGNIAKTGDNSLALTTINQISPIYVAFAIPQRFLVDVRGSIKEGTAKVLVTPQGMDTTVEGRISVIDNAVDAASGTLTVRAAFANADELLWPGALCNVRVIFKVEPDVVAVPREAVQTGQKGTFVFAVENGVAKVRPVTVNRTLDGQSVISSGLKGDEILVTDGQLLLTDGIRVEQRGAPKPPAAAGAAAEGEPKKGAS